jgi:hypothetical protein
MGKTFWWNNCGTIEELGKPKVERVVCDNGHQNQPSSGEGKVSSGAAEVPLDDGIAPPHTRSTILRVRAFAPRIRSEKRATIRANSRLSPSSLNRTTAVRLVRQT